jgi:hypothetical protein
MNECYMLKVLFDGYLVNIDLINESDTKQPTLLSE